MSSNIIDGPYLTDGSQKEKNPTAEDLVGKWEQFERRLDKMKVDYVIAFGSNVRNAFEKIDGVEYEIGSAYPRGRKRIVFAPHPSFVMVYRRKKLQRYISAVSDVISQDAAFA